VLGAHDQRAWETQVNGGIDLAGSGHGHENLDVVLAEPI
jgi:hypothetical protein